jgi:hypothetical protein
VLPNLGNNIKVKIVFFLDMFASENVSENESEYDLSLLKLY